MRKSDERTMLVDSVRESIAKSKKDRDFDRTRRYQQLFDEIEAGLLEGEGNSSNVRKDINSDPMRQQNEKYHGGNH